MPELAILPFHPATEYAIIKKTTVVVPVGVGILQQSLAVPMILLVATVVMFCKHRDNLVRILNGSEIGLRSTAKGENRINK